MKNKYRVSRPEDRRWQERTYASKAEMERAQQLYDLLAADVIVEIIEQPRLCLGDPEGVYIPDFLIIGRNGDCHFEDVKGVETPKFKTDVKRWERHGRLPLRIVKKKRNGRFEIDRVIYPIGRPAP